jgi:hypothetical protein
LSKVNIDGSSCDINALFACLAVDNVLHNDEVCNPTSVASRVNVILEASSSTILEVANNQMLQSAKVRMTATEGRPPARSSIYEGFNPQFARSRAFTSMKSLSKPEPISPSRRGSAMEKYSVKKSDDLEENQDEILTPIYASGQAFLSSFFDCLLVQAYYTAELLEIACALFEDDSIQLVALPSEFEGITYGEFTLQWLKAFCSAPLGLYRYPTASSHAMLPYVFTCPPNSTILHRRDRVYVFNARISSIPEAKEET